MAITGDQLAQDFVSYAHLLSFFGSLPLHKRPELLVFAVLLAKIAGNPQVMSTLAFVLSDPNAQSILDDILALLSTKTGAEVVSALSKAVSNRGN